LEALLFSSDQPLTLALLGESLEAEPDQIVASLRELGDAYAARGAGMELREIAGGWMLVTAAAQAEWVGRMLRGKRKLRLPRPEELRALIAAREPEQLDMMEVEVVSQVATDLALAEAAAADRSPTAELDLDDEDDAEHAELSGDDEDEDVEDAEDDDDDDD